MSFPSFFCRFYRSLGSRPLYSDLPEILSKFITYMLSGVMAGSRCHSWWRWWFDDITWVPLTRLWLLFFENWHNDCLQSAFVQFPLQSHRYADDECSSFAVICLMSFLGQMNFWSSCNYPSPDLQTKATWDLIFDVCGLVDGDMCQVSCGDTTPNAHWSRETTLLTSAVFSGFTFSIE